MVNILYWCIVGIILLFSVSRLRAEEVVFPFSVNIDRAAGKTGPYPNRVQDTAIKCWYVFVPAREYTIGSDNLTDSKSIRMRLRAFYVSEKQVTYQQFSEFLHAKHLNEIRVVKKETEKHLTPEQASLRKLQRSVDSITALDVIYPRVFEASRDLSKAVEGLLLDFDDEESDDGEERASNSDLTTPEKRRLGAVIVKEFDDAISNMRNQGQRPFDRVYFDHAREFAAWRNAKLPTEAQWEVAATLVQDGKLRASGFDDAVREWCSDYYSFKYFHRKKGFSNPQGPAKGRLPFRPSQTSSLVGQRHLGAVICRKLFGWR